MNSVDVVLHRLWPTQLCTDRLLMRAVTREDGILVRELLTDERVRAHLGGPVPEERVAVRQAAYPKTVGAWTVVHQTDGQPVGLVTLSPDRRREGRAEVSYQLLPTVWGQGLGREAVATILMWWADAVFANIPVIAVTQQANASSRRLLESVGMILVEEFDEYGERQCLYSTVGDDGLATER